MNISRIKIVTAFLLLNIVYIIKADDCDDVGPPRSFTVQIASRRVVMTWAAPENTAGCNIDYNLILNINGKEIQNIILDKVFHVYDDIHGDLNSCYKLVATLTPIINSNNHGTPTVKEISQEIGDPELSLAVASNRGILTWTKPENSDVCDVHYNLVITIDNREVLNMKEYTKEFYVLDNVDPCSELKATLVAETTSGIQSNEVYKLVSTGVAQIENLQLTDLTLSWDVTTKNSENCEYQILINGLPLGRTAATSYDLSVDDISGTPCTSTDILVRPIFNGMVGQSLSQLIDVPPTPIDDYEIEEFDDIVKIAWPIDYLRCDVNVKIGEIYSKLVDANHYVEIEKTEFLPCATYDVSVQVQYQGQDYGTPTIQQFTKKPEKLENFEVVFINGLILAQWSENFKNCIIEIMVDDTEVSTIEPSSSVYSRLEDNLFKLCVDHEISATAVDELKRRGEPAETTFRKSVDWSVDFFEIIERENGIIPSWSDSFEKCYIQIMVTHDDGFEVYDNDELENGETLLDRTDYINCVIYRFLFMVFDADDYVVDFTEDRYEKPFVDDFDVINDVAIEVKENSDESTVSFIATLLWETDCDLSYEISCSVDEEEAVSAENGITSNEYELIECPINEETSVFTITLKPFFEDKAGIEVLCRYEVDYTDDILSFKLIDDPSSSDKCPDSPNVVEEN